MRQTTIKEEKHIQNQYTEKKLNLKFKYDYKSRYTKFSDIYLNEDITASPQ